MDCPADHLLKEFLMQTFSTTEYPNSSEWHVYHDNRSQLFKIKNNRGRIMSPSFTDQRFADRHLDIYLSSLTAPKRKYVRKTDVKKEAPATSNGVS